MKKYIIDLGIILISLLILNINPSYGMEENSFKTNISSNDILSYIEENHLTNIKSLCSNEFCSYLKSTNLKRAIEIFKQDFSKYLKESKGEEIAQTILIKGFPITEIHLN